MENFSAAPMSRNSIGKITSEFRKIVGFENELYFPIDRIIEFIIMRIGVEVEYVPITEMPETYAITNPGAGTMKIREDVYIGAVNGNGRDRFTLCHELGHLLMHIPERVGFARGNIPKYRDPEWQANVFAGEIMAPAYLIKGLSVEQIMEKCGMSRQAAKIQFNECNKIYA